MKKISNLFFSAVIGFVMASVTGIIGLLPLVMVMLMIVAKHLPVGILGEGAPSGEGSNELETRISEKVNTLLKQHSLNLITNEVLEFRLSKIAEDMEKRGVHNTELETRVAKLNATIKGLSKVIDDMSESQKANLETRGEDIKTILLRDIFNTEAYKAYANNPTKANFQTRISLTYDYTGTTLIANQINVPVTPNERMSSMRELLASKGCVLSDPMASLVAPEVYEITDDTSVESENSAVNAVTFKAKENTWNVKRIGNFIGAISKRMLRNLNYISGYIAALLPRRIKWIEDWQMLFGDNAGDNLQGFFTNTKVPTFAMAGPTFAATAFASVATYNGGTQSKVTFAAEHGLISGYKITIANATHAGYNATFDVQILSAKSIILNVAYVAEAVGLVAAWTATSKHPLSLAIDNANEIDVITVALNLCQLGEYVPNAIILNPTVSTRIMTLKNSVEFDYLDIKGKAERINGVLYIAGFPCVETTAMPIDKFIVGNFAPDTVQLIDSQALEIVTAADVADVKQNQTNVIAQEELIFAILNPYVFLKGNFTAAKALLETA